MKYKQAVTSTMQQLVKVLMDEKSLHSLHVLAGSGVDLDGLTVLNE